MEVADTSLTRDRYKCRIYGLAGIAHYWIVNLVDRRLEAYSDPTGPDSQPGYRQREDFGFDDEAPLLLEGQEIGTILVSELLP